MTSTGLVRVWHDDEGWGVIDSPETPGGCWTHFSRVLMVGHRALRAGQSVSFTYRSPGQDGYAFVCTEVWSAGPEPDRSAKQVVNGPSAAYRSTLSLSFVEPGE